MKNFYVPKVLMFFTCLLFANSLWAYGGGGGTKTACKKPTFSALTPVHLAEVAPGTVISFKASARTDPDSIVVLAKKQALEISITKNNSSYSVSGMLPASLQNTFARIEVAAKSPSGCEGEEAWLVKISEGASSE